MKRKQLAPYVHAKSQKYLSEVMDPAEERRAKKYKLPPGSRDIKQKFKMCVSCRKRLEALEEKFSSEMDSYREEYLKIIMAENLERELLRRAFWGKKHERRT